MRQETGLVESRREALCGTDSMADGGSIWNKSRPKECRNARKDGSVKNCDASRGEMTGSAEKTRGNQTKDTRK
jgi:hypothetical protein